MLISDTYREQNKRLHEQRPDYGVRGGQWTPYIARMMEEERFEHVLDYGCGKGKLAETLKEKGKFIREYDPAIPGKDAEPEPAELVVCTDVLEHIEPVHLNAVIRDLCRVTQRKLFFNIALCPALKTLPDGRNAHLIIRDAGWWKEKLESEFHIIMWEQRAKDKIVFGEAVPRGAIKFETISTKRRQITPQWLRQIETIKSDVNRYADAFTKIVTTSVWQGVEDVHADMQFMVNLLEKMPDPDVALRDIARLSHKATVIVIKTDEVRNEGWWKKLIEKRFRIAMWHIEGPDVMMIGAPMVGVQGVLAVGAVDSDLRWEQVKEGAKRFPARITPAPPHERRAIICCYGPSLTGTIDHLREAIAEGGDIVSVSGAHDFLIANGIVPKYHVECDPRPHKADNIEKGHPDVQYLLASTVHKVLFDKLESFDIKLWHVSTPEHAAKLVDELKQDSQTVISGGGSVGLRSITLLYAMGYRNMSIFGMDCSFEVPADATNPEEVKQWAGKHAGKRQDLCEVDCAGRKFVSSPILMTYASNFFECAQKVTDLDIRLYGDGLLQAMARAFATTPQAENISTAQEAA